MSIVILLKITSISGRKWIGQEWRTINPKVLPLRLIRRCSDTEWRKEMTLLSRFRTAHFLAQLPLIWCSTKMSSIHRLQTYTITANTIRFVYANDDQPLPFFKTSRLWFFNRSSLRMGFGQKFSLHWTAKAITEMPSLSPSNRMKLIPFSFRQWWRIHPLCKTLKRKEYRRAAAELPTE